MNSVLIADDDVELCALLREYLTRGGIIDEPDGSISLDVKRSEADFLLWRIGASVGIVPRESAPE